MSTGRDELVIEAVIAALNEAPPSDIPDADGDAWLQGMPLEAPRIGVVPAKEQNTLPQRRHSQIAHRGLVVSVQCAAPAESVSQARQAIAPMAAHVIASLSHSTLDDLATDIEELERAWEYFKADLIYGVHTIFFQVNYQTARGDLTRKA